MVSDHDICLLSGLCPPCRCTQCIPGLTVIGLILLDQSKLSVSLTGQYKRSIDPKTNLSNRYLEKTFRMALHSPEPSNALSSNLNNGARLLPADLRAIAYKYWRAFYSVDAMLELTQVHGGSDGD